MLASGIREHGSDTVIGYICDWNHRRRYCCSARHLSAREDDVGWAGTTNLAGVVGGYALPDSSGAVLEKEVNGRRVDLGLRGRGRSERIRHSVQKALCRGYYWFLLFILSSFLMRFAFVFSTDPPCLIHV